ncbi:hypothetical protein [Shewanella glacialimarina]|uniref:hypothetical protein n=1 Tax=Shewanella glacialimarina TaxID=2590884 RepID=UPI001CF86011|nr:hypothetical protein [Shewanella glacialimarina]UCX05835.1 hypothetical protein FJ709_15900 [Shewanella glacialimarina]
MNEASQPSQQNPLIEEIKNRVLEVDALRHGTQHPENIELPLDYIEALDEVTSIDREEIEDIARDVIAKHKNITRVQPQKRQKNKQRDLNQWLINISLLLIISVTVKVVFLNDGSPKDPSEKTFATTIASTDFSALQQEATNTFSSMIDYAQALLPSAEDLPDIPFSIEDIDLAAIEESASQTFSSILQSAKDLLPQEDIQTANNDQVVQAEDEIIIAEQNLNEAAPVSETRASETKESEKPENLVANNSIDAASDTKSDSNSTSITSSKATLAIAQAAIAEAAIKKEQDVALAALKVTNKVIENAMTKGTTVEEELEKAALSNIDSINASTNTGAVTQITTAIEDVTNAPFTAEIASVIATEKPVIQQPIIEQSIEEKPPVDNSVAKSITANGNNTEVDVIANITDTSDKADEALALASKVESGDKVETISKEQKVATNTVEATDATEIAQNDISIDATNVEAEDIETLATEAMATMPIVMADTRLMKALDQAFTQLSNIKAPPRPELAIKATNIEAITDSKAADADAESLDIADTNSVATGKVNIAAANISTIDEQTTVADEQTATEPEKATTQSEVANSILPSETQLITQETLALIEQPKDIKAIDTKAIDSKALDSKEIDTQVMNDSQVTSAVPVELVAEAKSPEPTNVVSDKKQLVEESQTNLALTSVNPSPAVSTLNEKPISTEPEVTQLALADADIESVDDNATTEIAQNTPSNKASKVLRVTLGADEAIEEVTQKLIAAQQAPSNINAITQQAVTQIAQPKANNAEMAALTAQSKSVVSEQAASKTDEIAVQTVSTATKAPITKAPITVAPEINTDARFVATKQDAQSNYNGLNLKLQLNSIVDLSQLAKMSVSQFYSYKSRLPKPSDNIDLPINDLKAHPLIRDIYLSEQSDVVVKLAKYYGEDSQLIFTPSITNDGGLINWKCNANIDPSLLVGPGESPCSLTKSAAAPASNTKL